MGNCANKVETDTDITFQTEHKEIIKKFKENVIKEIVKLENQYKIKLFNKRIRKMNNGL
jgi:hypothetical protein